MTRLALFEARRELTALAVALIVAACLPGVVTGGPLGLPLLDETAFRIEAATFAVYVAAIAALALLHGAGLVRGVAARGAVGFAVAMAPAMLVVALSGRTLPLDRGAPEPPVAHANIELGLQGLFSTASFGLALSALALGLHVIGGALSLRRALRQRGVWVALPPGDGPAGAVRASIGAALGLLLCAPIGWEEHVDAVPTITELAMGFGVLAFAASRLPVDARACARLMGDEERAAFARTALAIGVAAALCTITSVVSRVAEVLRPSPVSRAEGAPFGWLLWIEAAWVLLVLSPSLRISFKAARIPGRVRAGLLAACGIFASAVLLGQWALRSGSQGKESSPSLVISSQRGAPVALVIFGVDVAADGATGLQLTEHIALLNASEQAVVVDRLEGRAGLAHRSLSFYDWWDKNRRLSVPPGERRNLDFEARLPLEAGRGTARERERAMQLERNYLVESIAHFADREGVIDDTISATYHLTLTDAQIALIVAASPETSTPGAQPADRAADEGHGPLN
ncbi:MAG: hypothetical protein M3O50_17985 [Myxococcota bacterium]|nr:hypothetical protein [Myxococcota bacterium]